MISSKNNIKKILIVRSDGIGDFILSLPALNAIRKYYPYAHITLFTGDWQEEIANASSIFNEVVIWGFCKEKYFTSPQKIKFLTYRMFKYIPRLLSRRFDIAIDFRNDYFINRIIMWLSKAEIRLGFNNGGLEFLLTHRIPDRAQAHKSAQFLELAFPLLGVKIDSSAELCIPETSQKKADEFIKENSIAPDDLIVVMHPVARWPAKVWPGVKFAELGDKILKLPKTKVVFAGDKTDLSNILKIASLMTKKAVISAGYLCLLETAALLKRAKIFIGNDAAPMHLAETLNIPSIGLFGPTEQNVFGSLKKNSFNVRKIDSVCPGCSKKYCIYPDNFCMDKISVDEVYFTAQKFLT